MAKGEKKEVKASKPGTKKTGGKTKIPGVQKKLSHARKSKSGITQYEWNFMPNPTDGPWESDSQFDEYHCFDFFDADTIKRSIEEFKGSLKQRKMSEDDYLKIEEGIKSFTESSTTLTREQALLYRSILRMNPDLLLEKFNRTEEEIRQLIGQNYFQNYQNLEQFPVDEKDLISVTSLQKYMKCAEKITYKRLAEWAELSVKRDGEAAWAQDFDKILIYRGFNNSKYYTRTQKKGDILSAYSGLDDQPVPYFEKRLISSYTLSPNLAEKFMVGSPHNKSQRRTVVEGNPELIQNRLLSSFCVSPNFISGQYEFLCLPDTGELKMVNEYNNSSYAKFTIFE